MDKKTKKMGQPSVSSLSWLFTIGVIVVAAIASYFIWSRIMGNPDYFEGRNPEGRVLGGNYLAIIYKGGPIVPLLMTVLLVLLTFSFERAITIIKARGRGGINVFVKNLQVYLTENKIDEAIVSCDRQKGSLANVMRAGLVRYKALQTDTTMDKDQKILALQKEFEEATALELPMLSKNLVILSTIASISVLIGLLGTVLGMIRAFKALAQAGAPDALALATGISEALVNTAFGIAGSLLAIILYNYFSTLIDNFTYKIDEAGFSLVQSFAASTK
jgi:biopolymer transport protein ExbB